MDSAWGDVPTWLGVVGAVIVFWLGRAEYRISQRWKRSEFLAAEVDRFFGQPRVATALLLLDYSEIRLEFDGTRARQHTATSVVLTDRVVTTALRIHTEFENETEQFRADEMLAREAFDELLTGFERFDHHIRVGLIEIEELKVYLGYWVEKLVDPSSKWKPPDFYEAVAGFVKAYQYVGAAHLFEVFDHPLRA